MSMAFRIKELRNARGWTQEHLASIVGCTKTHISEMESGKKNPSHPMMRSIAQAFGVSVTDLYGDDGAANALRAVALDRFDHLDEGRQRQAIAYLEFLLSQAAPSTE